MSNNQGNEEMRKRLALAIFRIQKGRTRVLSAARVRLNISNVAKEAGMAPATIHSVYPDIAEQIRALVGKGRRVQRDAKQQELSEARQINRAERGGQVAAQATC